PQVAAGLPAAMVQSDASRYRSPGALPPGAVLVVGSGQSGAQIADELALAGRDVLLATSRGPRVPRRYRGRDVHEWAAELGGSDQPTEAAGGPAGRGRRSRARCCPAPTAGTRSPTSNWPGTGCGCSAG